MLGETKIIFLDEPTSSNHLEYIIMIGIDPLSRRQIWDIINALKREGKTILFTTHFLDEAEYLSDKIFILKKGFKNMMIISRFIIHRRDTLRYQIKIEIRLYSDHKF